MYGQNDYGDVHKCFFFSPLEISFRESRFNNILFECLCSAEHGTTVGYKKTSEQIEPLLAKWESAWNVSLQIEICRAYARIFVKMNKNWNADSLANIKATEKLFHLFMKRPSKEEAKTYGSILFDDDTHENHLIPLAIPVSKTELNKMLLFSRAFGKIFKVPLQICPQMRFWPEGCLALSDISNICRNLYRFDFTLKDCISAAMRYFRRRRK